MKDKIDKLIINLNNLIDNYYNKSINEQLKIDKIVRNSVSIIDSPKLLLKLELKKSITTS